MIHERDIAILRRLLSATKSKAVSWRQGADGWYSSQIGGGEVCFRFLYYEATNQVGADRVMIDFMMPGRNARFACGTEGYDLFMELMAIISDAYSGNGFDPLEFLNTHCPIEDRSSESR